MSVTSMKDFLARKQPELGVETREGAEVDVMEVFPDLWLPQCPDCGSFMLMAFHDDGIQESISPSAMCPHCSFGESEGDPDKAS